MSTDARIRQPRTAEIVAAVLRRRILDGELADGEVLSPQSRLLEEFGVSRPSIRDAFWILQSEGLLTVRRGKHGGAIVHTPKAEGTSKMIGMVLEVERVSASDLAEAIDLLEPTCGKQCAQRAVEDESIVAELETLVEESKSVIEDRLAFLQSSQKFHDAIVRLAGNRTLALVAGALNELWSVQQLERGGTVDGEQSIERRNAAVHDHEAIVDAIRRGDEAETAKRLQEHLYVAQKMVMADEAVSSPVVVADPRNLAWSELRQTSKRGPTSRNL